jgi:hypothetical protein
MEDFDELVSSLTPRGGGGGVRLYQNTVSIACPACEKPFDSLVVCEEEFTSLELDAAVDICATTHEGKPILFTHR